MLSLEPWTLKDIGSPQAFQTGETFRRAPLIDYQHPHDLIMGLGAAYRVPWQSPDVALLRRRCRHRRRSGRRCSCIARRRPTIRRRRSRITTSIRCTSRLACSRRVRRRARGRSRASWFRGREPDENRTDLDLGPLDSYSVRLGWARGAWSAQASGAALTMPEAVTPYDAKKLSASVSYDATGSASLAWTVGVRTEPRDSRQPRGVSARRPDAAHGRATPSTRASNRSPRTFSMPDSTRPARSIAIASRRSARSRSATCAISGRRATRRFGVGGDVTGYLVPDNLREAYGAPVSFHVFLRYRRGQAGRAGVTHVH